jgi:hypothetical protein
MTHVKPNKIIKKNVKHLLVALRKNSKEDGCSDGRGSSDGKKVKAS